MRRLLLASPLAFLLFATPARAQDSVAEWNARFAEARTNLLQGEFAECETKMIGLAATAPTPETKAIASEEADLCHRWVEKGVVFVKKSDLGESSIAAKAQGIRTTDELAVLYTNAVVFGLGTGAWLAAQTEPKDAAGGLLPALGFAGLAAGGVALADHSSTFKYGVPQSIVTGMYIGFYEGLTWTLWNQASARYVDEWSGKTVATVIWGSAAAGAIAGGIVGSYGGTTPGRASYVGSTALWSGLIGGLLGGALSADDHHQRDDNALLASAVALNAGSLLGVLTASKVSPSIARVRFMDLGGLAGGLLFGGLYLAASDKNADARGALGVTALGIGAGLAVATFATAGMTPDTAPGETAKNKDKSFVSSIAPSLAPTKGGGMATLSAVF